MGRTAAPVKTRTRKQPAAEASAPGLELVKLEDLTPYARNSRTHSPAQVAKLAASLDEWGMVGAIVVRDGVIAKGHGTLEAIRRLYAGRKRLYPAPGKGDPQVKPYPAGMVPVLRVDGWTEAQFRAYVIADNRLALDAGWDEELLALELEDLRAGEFDLDLTGFGSDELDLMFGAPGEDGTPYSQKIEAPIYTPKGEQPSIESLTDRSKALELAQAIRDAEGLGEAERNFLLLAAQRHVVFDYHAIAEFYCHASPQVQALMEASALVIIDFGKAIEGGFVRMSERLDAIYENAYGADDGDAQG